MEGTRCFMRLKDGDSSAPQMLQLYPGSAIPVRKSLSNACVSPGSSPTS